MVTLQTHTRKPSIMFVSMHIWILNYANTFSSLAWLSALIQLSIHILIFLQLFVITTATGPKLSCLFCSELACRQSSLACLCQFVSISNRAVCSFVCLSDWQHTHTHTNTVSSAVVTVCVLCYARRSDCSAMCTIIKVHELGLHKKGLSPWQ